MSRGLLARPKKGGAFYSRDIWPKPALVWQLRLERFPLELNRDTAPSPFVGEGWGGGYFKH